VWYAYYEGFIKWIPYKFELEIKNVSSTFRPLLLNGSSRV
jgi:hypothetical protein